MGILLQLARMAARAWAGARMHAGPALGGVGRVKGLVTCDLLIGGMGGEQEGGGGMWGGQAEIVLLFL